MILACRNPEKAEEARVDIIHTTNNNNVEVKILDLGSFQSIRDFAADVNQSMNSNMISSFFNFFPILNVNH